MHTPTMKEGAEKRKRASLLITALLLGAVLIAVRSSFGLLGSAGFLGTCRDAGAGRLTILGGGGDVCTELPRFRRYVPSVWEWEW